MNNKFFYIVAVAAFLAGCSADDLTDWKEQSGGLGINFGASAPTSDDVSRGGAASSSQSFILKSDNSADSLAVYVESNPGFIAAGTVSRGAPTTDVDFSAFSVSAFYYRDAAADVPSLFFEEEVTRQAGGAWSTGTIYYWPTTEGSQLAFLGVSPSDIASNSFYGVTLDAGSESGYSLTYTAPDEAESQPDLMVAVAGKQNGHNQTGYRVPMQFSHILSQVSFVVGSEMQDGTINSITLDGIAASGTYSGADGKWTLVEGDVRSYTIDINKPMSTDTPPDDGINTVEQTLMMLPQTLSADSRLTVMFTKEGATEPTVLTASLAGTWLMGGSTVYRINIKPDFTLEFAESGIPPLDAHYEKFEINVRSENLPEGWTLTSNYPDDVFFTSELSEMQRAGYWIENKKGKNTVSGVGNQHFYVYVTENALDENGNLTNTDRNIELILTPNKDVDSPDVTLAVTQYCPALSADGSLGAERILDPGKYPWGFKFDNVTVTYTYPSADNFWGLIFLEAYKWLIFDSVYISGWLGITTMPDYVVRGSGTTICTFNLSDIQFNAAQSVDDGRVNSWNLYNYDGYSAVNALDSYFGSNPNIVRTITPEDVSFDIISNYAAFMVLKNCNKFSEGSQQQGDATLSFAVLAETDCVWYLPASGQYSMISNVANLTEGTKYWTSTSDASYDNAYTFTAHSTVNSPESRMNEYNVVAVRSK